MDSLVQFFIDYGYWGMFLAAALAGSVAPFSSELVMGGLQTAGLDAWTLVVVATIGNTAGGLFNYGLGYLGKTRWIARLFKIPEDKMRRAMARVRHYGIWVGLLSWVPFLGEALTLAMGLSRCPLLPTTLTILTGKFVRYAIVMLAVGQVINS